MPFKNYPFSDWEKGKAKMCHLAVKTIFLENWSSRKCSLQRGSEIWPFEIQTHLKSGLFKGRISNSPVFKWSGFCYGYFYSPNHSKTGPFDYFVRISNVFFTKLRPFVWISNGWASEIQIPFKIQTIWNSTSFRPFKIQTGLDFRSPVTCF